MTYNKIYQKKSRRKARGKIYYTSRLHELEDLLSPYFSMISLNEFLDSNSGALYAFYKYPYRIFSKELSIFMDRDKFVVYDSLNEETVTDYSKSLCFCKKKINSEH